jgi:hypothetical protein
MQYGSLQHVVWPLPRFLESDFREHRRFLASDRCKAEPFEKLHLVRDGEQLLIRVRQPWSFTLFAEFRRALVQTGLSNEVG